MKETLNGRVVVVSPHLDDAVLSLGATIAAAVRCGATVEVLSVFCGDPFSQAAAGPWDRHAGFSSEGEASRSRREEDRAACGTLGARSHWLAFADEQYDRHGGEAEIGPAVLKATQGADAVLIPGSPLTNPDHAWLVAMLLRKRFDCRRLGLYVEQPYTFQGPGGGVPALSGVVKSGVPQTPTWRPTDTSSGDWTLKRRALNCYRSQLGQLGLGFIGLRRMLGSERARGGETVAWLAR
jgi:LmbE family N-acetylglucosaminyl deacetylase